MAVFPNPRTLLDYVDMGGFVMLPLLIVAGLLWYALVFRWLSVRSSRRDPRTLVRHARENRLTSRSLPARAAMDAVAITRAAASREALKSQLNERFSRYRLDLGRHRALVRSLVAVAPLLGLLGTVDGMIETFDALGDMNLFSESGGIAGGISRALFTTQIGLAISIPGLLLGRMIDHRQRLISRELDQIRDIVCAETPAGAGDATHAL